MGHRSGGWSPVDPTLEKEGKQQNFQGLTTDILADHAITYLEKQTANAPFLLCWHTRAPHARWLPVADEDWTPLKDLDPTIPNPDFPKLDTKRVKESTREYLASVRGVDRNLGRVLNALDRLDMSENTVVVFTSDHGYQMGHNGIWHKDNAHWILTEPTAAQPHIPRGQRPNMYDHSLRVPTAIRWPGVIKPGTTVDALVSNLDWFPTLLDIAKLTIPDNITIRGRRLPLEKWSKGLYNGVFRKHFFAQYSTRHQTQTHMRAVHTVRWKYMRDFLNPNRSELYDLKNDPSETTNLIQSTNPATTATQQDLDQRLTEWMSSIQDPIRPRRAATALGTGRQGYSGDGGLATEADLNQPFGVIIGPDNCLYVCDTGNHAVRKVDRQGIITTIAGTGIAGYSGDGGPAIKATMFEPYELRFDTHGDLFIVEMKNHLIRKVAMKSGIILTFAGTGTQGFGGDGWPAMAAQLSRPHSLQFSPTGDLYICDIGNHRVRKVTTLTGTITTIGGNGAKQMPEDDDPFASAPLHGPRALDFDANGDLWLALREGNTVYQFDMDTGILHHRAGTGKKGFGGHGGPAKDATLSGPKGLSIGPAGRVYLADTESHSVRMLDPFTTHLELIAGNGSRGDGPDGQALLCKMDRLHGIFVGGDGSIYVGDTNTHRVRVFQ